MIAFLFAAIYQTNDIQKIKKNEKEYFKAQSIEMNPLLLSLGSIFSSGVAISDHPSSPETATFTTIGNFMEDFKLSSKRYV
ncbi:MAG: DUF2145 domain-containing protein [Desulfobacula sp.]|nr:DUF2145 domain-containing protein [Desulfobacula sp.]